MEMHTIPPPSYAPHDPARGFQPPPVINIIQVGPNPANIRCPACLNNVTTRIEYAANTRTHLFAGLCFICGLWPCCFIPYCMNSCQSANHYCSNCNAFIGTYEK